MQERYSATTQRGSSPFFSMDSRDGWILLGLLIAFLASRLAWLLWNPVSSAYWEEAYRWMAAHELLTDPLQSFLDYQADHYQGGSLVMILLTVPFFKLFGESVLSLKICALLFSTGSLSMIYILGRKAFGRPVGILAALSYLAGPPLVAYWGLVGLGSHTESILFSLLQILLFLGILSGNWRGLGGWTAFGLVSGLGLWFCPTTGMTLAACVLSLILLGGLPSAKEFLWASAGGVAGLLPWFAYNYAYDFEGPKRILQMFGHGDPIDSWVSQSIPTKFVNLIRYDLPVGLLSPMEGSLSYPALVAVVLAFCIPLLFLLAFALVRVTGLFTKRSSRDPSRNELDDLGARRSELVFIVYGFIFLAVFLTSKFTVERYDWPVTYRLFTVPAVLLMFPAANTVIRALGRGKTIGALALGGYALVLVSAAAGTAALAMRPPDDGQRPSLERGYTAFGLLLHRKYEQDLSRALDLADRVPDPRMLKRVWTGIGWGIEYRFEKQGSLGEIRRELERMAPAARKRVVLGIHYFANLRTEQVHLRAEGPDPGRYYGRILDRLGLLLDFANEERRRLAID